MSVSHKKINGLIEQVIMQSPELEFSESQLIELCQRIYLIESSVDDKARSQLISDIKDEVVRRSNRVLENES